MSALRQLALFLAAGATLVGVVALAGWLVGAGDLHTIRGISVKGNTAIALICLGTAVLLSGRDARAFAVAAQAL
ncbi:MAG TPA: hypothetical protein VD838_18840, partial [Anaeromyxobacteraceae bacterium]|nr:hypothetical protein [Anaeromyxobacteraceae bacterium]